MSNSTIEIIEPKSERDWLEMRARDVTSTEAGALFGISPYTTIYELYFRKKDGLIVELEPNERMKWGNRLQDAIAGGLAEENRWDVRRRTAYHRIPGLRMGSSYDFEVGDEGLLEIKNVDWIAFRDGWIEDGEHVEAPPHIELQLQHQFACDPRRKWGVIGALVGGNRLVKIRREPDAAIIDRLKEKVTGLWDAIAANREPKPDFSRDAEFIARLCGQSDPSKVFDARGDSGISNLASEYRRISEEMKRLETERNAVKSELLMTIGDSAKVLGDGFSITAGTVAPSIIETHERKGYRNFRVNWQKEKAV